MNVSLQVLKRCLQIKQIDDAQLAMIKSDLEEHMANLVAISKLD